MYRLLLRLTRAFLLLGAISAIGCSANQSVPTGPSDAVSPTALHRFATSGTPATRFDRERFFAATTAHSWTPEVHENRRRSWMVPDAAKRLLLYVSSVGDGSVDVYDYKTGKQYGQLTGLQYPYGQCVDRAGNVYVTQFFGAAVTEYAHGATSPMRTISGPSYPIGCSIDPSTGNLAVSSWIDAYGSTQCGGVWVYPDASGTPTLYTDPKICQGYWPPGYDPDGNLFVEVDGPPSYLEELPRVGSALVELSLRGGVIHLPTSVMWHGR